jgi:hypothetical protein
MQCIRKEKKEIPCKRACGGHRVHNGYTVLYEQGTKGWCPGMCVDIIPDRYVYVMAVLSGARVVRVLCVCGCLMLRGRLMMRRGCVRVCSVSIDSAW